MAEDRFRMHNSPSNRPDSPSRPSSKFSFRPPSTAAPSNSHISNAGRAIKRQRPDSDSESFDHEQQSLGPYRVDTYMPIKRMGYEKPMKVEKYVKIHSPVYISELTTREETLRHRCPWHTSASTLLPVASVVRPSTSSFYRRASCGRFQSTGRS